MEKQLLSPPRGDKGLEIDVERGTADDQGLHNRESKSAPTSSRQTVILALGFFCGMCLMELALEGAGKWYGHLHSLAAAVTLSQFAGCLGMPLALASLSSRGGDKSSAKEMLWQFPFTDVKMVGLYIILSLLVSGSTALATASLYYVSYTTKVAFKSAKLVPTMLVATATGSRRYTAREYTAALLLCVGAGSFALDPGSGSNGRESSEPTEWSQAGIGLSMLSVAILCDALVPNAQSRLLETQISARQLMVNTNLVGLVLALGWMVSLGEFAEVIAATVVSPLLLVLLCLVGASLALAVLCYTMLIESAGPVVAVSVATLRKTATIALSYIFFPKPWTLTRIIGVTAVVAGIVLASKSSAAVAQWLLRRRTPKTEERLNPARQL